MDTSKQALRRRRWTIEDKGRIVEETLEAGASVARVAQRYAVNANQIFNWRREYREGRLGNSPLTRLLPVKVADEELIEVSKAEELAVPSPLGTLEIKLPKGNLHITGRVDLLALRTAIECLVR